MSKRIVVSALVLGLAGFCGWAFAQRGPDGKGPPMGRSGNYTVQAAGQTAILLETTTGKTWIMNQGVDGDSAWVPAKRLENEEQARDWLARERRRAEAVSEVQREMASKLESLRSGSGQKGTPDKK